ncbi:MAG: MGMT family protein [Candidatus Yanofskybacteria bacterium]|nr:MGMT family protein [Candidatus Yanofskybacteria bacterium]
MTPFQQKVYDFVQTIPKGETATYKNVAVGIGHPKAYRAVGSALNRNPFIGRVSCHRVIKSNGQIGGYVLGTNKKLELLKKESLNS